MQHHATGLHRLEAGTARSATSAELPASSWEDTPNGQEAELVDIELLDLDGSPRLEGENEAHTRVLAEALAPLPPVLVHRQTMRVIDGVHRVQAARLRAEKTIHVVYFDGDAKDAFVRAVEANVSHGLPLSLTDRREAAVRILGFYPEWSDRAIAAVAGLSATTVRSLRDRATAGSEQLRTRLGKDGKVRPLDAGAARRRAASLIAERPHASLREVASAAGVSVGTARDVRRRLREGEDPVPKRAGASQSAGTREIVDGRGESGRANGGRLRQLRSFHGQRSPQSILDDLRRDPSLRYSELGRSIVRWLDGHVVDAGDRSKISQSVPPHCAYAIAELAIGCASVWEGMAQELMAATDFDKAAS